MEMPQRRGTSNSIEMAITTKMTGTTVLQTMKTNLSYPFSLQRIWVCLLIYLIDRVR